MGTVYKFDSRFVPSWPNDDSDSDSDEIENTTHLLAADIEKPASQRKLRRTSAAFLLENCCAKKCFSKITSAEFASFETQYKDQWTQQLRNKFVLEHIWNHIEISAVTGEVLRSKVYEFSSKRICEKGFKIIYDLSDDAFDRLIRLHDLRIQGIFTKAYNHKITF
jgi:hypothetical protein